MLGAGLDPGLGVSVSVASSASEPDSRPLDLSMDDRHVLDFVRSRLYALSVVDCTPL